MKRTGGVSFVGLLTMVFIVLKLTGVIGWSWWWVLSPLWISILAMIVIILTVLTFVGFIKALIDIDGGR